MTRNHASRRRFLAVVSGLCLAFAAATATAQYTLYEYVLQEQTGFSPAPYFNGIAAGPDGAIWTLNVFNPHPIVQQWPFPQQPPSVSLFGSPPGETPFGAITNDATSLWLAGGKHLIRVDTTNGNAFNLVPFVDGQLHSIDSIASDGNGKVWFTDQVTTGRWIGAAGAISAADLVPLGGTGCEQAIFGRDMARDASGNVWFTANDHVCRIQTFDGSLSSQLLKDANGQAYGTAAGIALGPDGRMWVTSYAGPTGALLAFDPNSCGPGSNCVVVPYTLPPTARELHAVAAGPDGRIWFTADKDTPGVGSVKTDGSDFQYNPFSNLAIPPDARPNKITAGPQGDNSVWFTDNVVTTRIWRVNGLAASSSLLLQGGRFKLDVTWQVPPQGSSGVGTAVPVAPDTGAFWFFSPNNLELMIKVLDGRAINGHWWVFYGALTNVEFDLTVTDLTTGTVQTYHNPYGTQASVQDTSAFSIVSPPPQQSSVHQVQGALAAFDPADLVRAERASPGTPLPEAAQAACTPDAQTLCLNASRFKVQVAWDVPPQGTSGNGTANALTGDTGTFWFFSSDNLELILKVLDGRAINNHFWVFYGALSNVEYTITITDTQTGTVRTYHNPYQNVASVSDTSAF